MHASSECTFLLPPQAPTDCFQRSNRMLPFAPAWSKPQQHPSAHLQAFGDNGQSSRRRSRSSTSTSRSSERREGWKPMIYRSRRTLAQGRGKASTRQQQQQQPQDLDGRRCSEDRGGEAFAAAVADDVPGRQPRHRQEEQQPQELPIPSPIDRSPSASGEGVVVLDDPFEELEGNRSRYSCVVYDTLSAGPTPYNDSWEWQKKTLARLAERPDDVSSADAELDSVLLTQHDAVFTLGTGSTLDNLRFEPSDAPFGEVVRTERGGEVTYHGPGQIVMYPIMNLRRYRQDIHWYLRALEETVIRTLAKLGVKGERLEGLTGVWVDGCKVAAVGVRVKRWVTMHGLSLNVHPNLEHFKHIVPCGIGDLPVGSLEQLCAEDEDVSLSRVGRLLLESFEEVFGVSAAVGSLPVPPLQPTVPPPETRQEGEL
ncbi:unnamed protein product [Scytosiphon promiscuus]